MKNSESTNKKIENLVREIANTYKGDSGINFIDASNLPVRDKIIEVLELLTEVLFPGYTGKRTVTKSNIDFIVIDVLYHVYTELTDQIERAYRYRRRMEKCDGINCRAMAEEATEHLLSHIPKIRELLKGDVAAAYDGDPAARSYEEIVISYPCVIAISTYRIAHELFVKEVPLIPRIMSEYAHRLTGIDINPGATIGKRFFIDHGTGVVIGETSVIGDNVKIYQGTTLGAMSFPKDERGRIIKGTKRHPTIEDNVTIYAEATILGDVVIGEGAVIGGNVWVKESVPAGVTVTMANAELVQKEEEITVVNDTAIYYYGDLVLVERVLQKIEELKKQRNAVILAHNYQSGEIQDLADYCGDSLGLSVTAANTEADVIVFCGVVFMAETAAILSPDKTVLIPDKYAGCPMADMITAEQLCELKAQHPGAIVVCYVNSSAEVKAESDYCCTSSNAVEVVRSLPEDADIIFVPDQHLGSFVAEKTGRNVILWPGYCPTHVIMDPDELEKTKRKYPDAVVLAHPECPRPIKQLADELLSTGQMLAFAGKSELKQFIIATEVGIIHTLKKQNPDKQFYPGSDRAICSNMKKITLDKVINSLENMEYRVTVPEEISIKAKSRLIE